MENFKFVGVCLLLSSLILSAAIDYLFWFSLKWKPDFWIRGLKRLPYGK
jgi:hypothetical protein